MGVIIKLDQQTTNLIAAGEVIERPASVVKELVENAIDADAKNIRIKLIDAGIKEISVSDDGVGMDASDAKLAVESHATSKIKSGNDLFRIQTLGFRGEALPSIAAVSHFRLKTSTDGVKGFMYNLKGGVLVSEAMVASQKGTEIVVKNLFFNTPARLQSMQSQVSELSHVSDFITKMALANPDIAFTLINNDREIINTYGNNNLLEVIFSSYGSDVAKEMIEIQGENQYFKIKGYISKISVTRSSKNHINIIVNGRVIKNNNIIYSVIKGYDDRLMHTRYPIAVINIELDPGLVDVNVHPAKLEVRFSNEKDLLMLIENTVSQHLQKTNLVVDLDDFDYQQYDQELQNESEDDYVVLDSYTEESQTPITNEQNQEQQYFQQNYSFLEKKQQYSQEKSDELPLMSYIGQLHGTYILAQAEDEFYIIDQHAAAERINYEKILKELKKDEVNTYELLVPFNLEFTASESILINEHLNDFINLGIRLEDFGSNVFTVRELPIWIKRGQEKPYVEEIITQIINNQKKEKYQFLMGLAKSIACKKSIKANEYHSVLEIEYLLEDLANADNPYTCPHGRPVVVKFSKYEIEKWFKRVV